MSRSKELTKKTLIIAIGRISTQLIAFLLLPLYTKLLSTEEYGSVELVTTLVHLFVPIVSLMLDQGVFRILLNCKSEIDKKKAISSGFWTLTGFNILFFIIFCIGSVNIHKDYKIWLFLILIATTYNNLFLQIARGLNQTKDYALGSFISSLSIIIINVFCIVYLKMGVVGMLLATFCGNLISCLFLLIKVKFYKYISLKHLEKSCIVETLVYSVPLVPNQLSLWVMNGSDRLIVTLFLGMSVNGILAVSQKFSAAFTTVFWIFQLAWHEVGVMHYFDKDRDIFFSDMIEKIILMFSVFCIGTIIIIPLVFNWFINPMYNSAYFNIPIYLIAALFNVVIGLLGIVYVAKKNTFEIAKSTMLAAFINIIINLLLIKFLGLFAASISTFMGYLITMIYRIIDTKKYLKIKYNLKLYVSLTISITVCTLVYYLNSKLISCVLLLIFLLSVIYFYKGIILLYFKKSKIILKKFLMTILSRP
ncbi:lipopolysaccharide biosynthesis protein [Holdemania filiformis]|nr:oligosaccharide flippase family protein [Holdemania filiformis]